jgi:hypothetical protein
MLDMDTLTSGLSSIGQSDPLFVNEPSQRLTGLPDFIETNRLGY